MSEYKKAVQTYNALAEKAKAGDKQAHADKAKAMLEVRQIQRQAAREGTILSHNMKEGQVVVSTEDAPTKRSLQEEYVRSFDDKAEVKVGNQHQEEQVTTLRKYHSKRLLGK